VFPDLFSAAYKVTGTVQTGDPNVPTMPVTLIRSGDKQRIEMTMPGVGAGAFVVDSATKKAFFLIDGPQGKIAMAFDGDQVPTAGEERWRDTTKVERVGACSGAGETGTEWRNTLNTSVYSMCVTNDGVILSSKDGDRTVWTTQSIVRGPQDAAQFVVPDGYQKLDIAGMMKNPGAMAEKFAKPPAGGR
jgi:hypothetical protein